MTTSVDKYMLRGVSSQKSEVHQAISHLDKGLYPRAFCKIIPDAIGNEAAYCNVMHADGAGTKSSLAWMYWKETGDLSVWRGIAQDALVMNLNDLLCVGITGPILISSTIGRNKHKVPGEVLAALIEGTISFIDSLKPYGVELILTGGETADVGDLVRTVIVDSTVTARVRKSDIIDNSQIAPGQVIVGFSSYGQAVYESEYNGGMGSNGLTSARHDLFSKIYATRFPESFDTDLNNDLVYNGPYQLTDDIAIQEGEKSFKVKAGKLVLSPTRTFSPLAVLLFRNYRDKIRGMVHCSGGGQTKVLHFTENVHVVKNQMIPVPPLFQLIQKSSGLSGEMMMQTFNMGTLLEIYTDPESAAGMIEIAASLGIHAQIIGYTEASEENKLTIEENGYVYKYQK